jgi:hypothetical protein
MKKSLEYVFKGQVYFLCLPKSPGIGAIDLTGNWGKNEICFLIFIHEIIFPFSKRRK